MSPRSASSEQPFWCLQVKHQWNPAGVIHCLKVVFWVFSGGFQELIFCPSVWLNLSTDPMSASKKHIQYVCSPCLQHHYSLIQILRNFFCPKVRTGYFACSKSNTKINMGVSNFLNLGVTVNYIFSLVRQIFLVSSWGSNSFSKRTLMTTSLQHTLEDFFFPLFCFIIIQRRP